MGFPLILVDGCWKYQWQYSWTFVVEIDMYICKDYVQMFISADRLYRKVYKAEDVTITAEDTVVTFVLVALPCRFGPALALDTEDPRVKCELWVPLVKDFFLK